MSGPEVAVAAPELTGAQRKYLRGLAHELSPVVLVGKAGLSEGLLETIDQALESHELIKVKFNDFKDQKAELAAKAAARLGAAEVGKVGHVVIFFRPARDEKKRQVTLPRGDRRRTPLEV